MSNGEEIVVDFEGNFLIWPEGAHLNIAGVSGLASKTSYAMFLCSALQQRRADDISLVIFNVKGFDLLSINEPAKPVDLSAADRKNWEKCGLKAVAMSITSRTFIHIQAIAVRRTMLQSYLNGVHKRQIANDTLSSLRLSC